MTTTPDPRPSVTKTRGRKALPKELRTVTKSCRLTPEGWAQFTLLGGNRWLADAVALAYKERTQNKNQEKENPPS